jgi:hypothetical protein
MIPEVGYTLRLAPTPRPDGFEVGQTLSAGGEVRARAKVVVSRLLTRDELTDIQWYHENFPLYPVPSAVRIADLVARRAALAGTALHESLFVHDPDGARIWSVVAPALHHTRIEIEVDSGPVDAYPWELLRAGPDALPLSVAAEAFVRVYAALGQLPPQPTTEGDRVLMVICRPDAELDVPFRSVAGRLLTDNNAAPVASHVLRPPTFESLGRVLREAYDHSQPFRVVHFDGHGVYTDLFGSGDERGYLVFEDPAAAENRALVNGTKLGRLLARYGVRILVVNACRSAHVGLAASPDVPDNGAAAAVSAYGSLASEIIRAGVVGVVAMRYNVWVDTAAAFTAAVYAALVGGDSLAGAVQSARQHLFSGRAADRPLGHPVEDWQVPVVYEPEPVHVRLARRDRGDVPILLHGFPPVPPCGYVGHDAAILAIDRAFDQHRLVLLHGPAGSGKTGVLAEYARWAAATGQPAGTALYQSLAACRSVRELVDTIGPTVTDPRLWDELAPGERRAALLGALRRSPALLVLDEADRVAGALPGREAVWPEGERDGLHDLIGELTATGTRILVGGRKVDGWLGGLGGISLTVADIPPSDRYVLVQRLARAAGRLVTDPTDWDPLLEHAAGNGLGLVALIELGLAAGIDSRRACRELVDRIRDGELTWADGISRECVRALETELSRALERFDPRRRAQLALLTFFTGMFTETTVRYLGQSDRPWAVDEIAGISAIDLVSLLYEFAETGWLRPLTGGYFLGHPLLPLLLRPHFERLYTGRAEDVVRAVVEVMAAMGEFVVGEYRQGEQFWTEGMKHELLDMRYALHLAVARGWWPRIVPIMEAIQLPMQNRQHESDWADLVEAVSPIFVTDEGAPVPGREPYWVVVLHYRIALARARNAFTEAEQLAETCCRWLRQLRSETGDPRMQSYWTVWLARTLQDLGRMRMAFADPACLDAFREAYELFIDQGMREAAGRCARDLAAAYGKGQEAQEYYDDEQAEAWIRRAVALIPDDEESLSLLSALRSLLEARRAAGPDWQRRHEPMPVETREDRARLARELRDDFGSYFDLYANELPLPTRGDPRARMHALKTRANLRLLQQDERGFVDYLEALQIANNLNELMEQADIELELARESYASHRHDHAAVYAAAALDHFTVAGRRGADGEGKARALLGQIEGTDNRA